MNGLSDGDFVARKADPKTREKILDEAEHLIHLRGYHLTTMEDIAGRCKMTKANLFYHFPSKENIGLSVLDAKIAEYQKRRVEPLCAGKNIVKAIDNLFEAAAEHYEKNGCRAGCLVANIALEMSDVNSLFREKASAFFSAWSENLSHSFACAQKKGLLRTDLSPRALAEAIISLYEGAVMLARTHKDPVVFRRMGKLARIILTQKSRTREG
jgi:TetR/AcrR family transcriptional repressor of nem operon